jgi:hypothetical protein
MTPKNECEALLAELKGSAENVLARYGEFHPFGGTIKTNGQIAIVNALSGIQFPAGRHLVASLAEAFREEAAKGKIRAAGIAANVVVVPPDSTVSQDAIRISLDHRDDYTVHVFFPYRFSEDKVLALNKPFATRGRSFAFHGEPLADWPVVG